MECLNLGNDGRDCRFKVFCQGVCVMSQAIDKIGSAFLRQVLRRMKQLGLNQSALAERMNVSRPYISKVLKSDVNISFATAAKLARALQMDFFPELRAKE